MAGNNLLLEKSLKENWTKNELKDLSIQTRNQQKCLIRSDKEDDIKCILRNIATLRNWKNDASQKEALATRITELEKTNEALKATNEKLEQEIIRDQKDIKQVPHHQQITPTSSHAMLAENVPDKSAMQDDMKTENNKLHEEMSEVESGKEKVQAPLDEMNRENETSREEMSEVKRLKLKVEELQEELKTAQEKMEKAKREFDRKLQEQSSLLQAMTNEKEDLNTQLCEANRKLNEADKKRIVIENEDDKQREQPSLQEVPRESNSQSPCAVNDIKISDANRELEEKSLQLDEVKTEVQNLKQQLQEVNKEKKELDEKLANIVKENEAVQRTKEMEEKALKKELEQARKKVSDSARQEEAHIAALTHQLDELKKNHQSAENKQKEELNNANKEIKNLQNLNKNLQENINARNAGKEVEYLKGQVKDLTERLATEMNSKISGDESALENISISNRPMKLADDYQDFCSHVWLDAKEALDNDGKFEQKDAIVLLQKVLMVSQESCSSAAKGVNRILLQLLNEPVKGKYHAGEKKGPMPVIPDSARALFNGAGDYLRRTADTVDVRSVIEEVTKELASMSNNFMQTAYKTYIEEAVRLSWKMVIQRPAMTFSVEGENEKWEGDQTQELYWGSHPENKGAVVRYYVHPKLKHGDKLMVKGRVLVE